MKKIILVLLICVVPSISFGVDALTPILRSAGIGPGSFLKEAVSTLELFPVNASIQMVGVSIRDNIVPTIAGIYLIDAESNILSQRANQNTAVTPELINDLSRAYGLGIETPPWRVYQTKEQMLERFSNTCLSIISRINHYEDREKADTLFASFLKSVLDLPLVLVARDSRTTDVVLGHSFEKRLAGFLNTMEEVFNVLSLPEIYDELGLFYERVLNGKNGHNLSYAGIYQMLETNFEALKGVLTYFYGELNAEGASYAAIIDQANTGLYATSISAAGFYSDFIEGKVEELKLMSRNPDAWFAGNSRGN